MSLMNLYETTTDIQFYSQKPGVSIPDVEAKIPFHVEFEARSWGIKSINLYFSDKLKVDYIEENDEGEIERQIEIDLSRLNKFELAGHAITVSGITIYLDENGLVDYSKSEITINLIRPN